MRRSISTLPVILSFTTFSVAQTFWVERHLDVVLKVLQGVDFKNNQTTKQLNKFI